MRSGPGLAPRTDALEILLDVCGKPLTRSESSLIYNPRGPSRLHFIGTYNKNQEREKGSPSDHLYHFDDWRGKQT